MSQKGCFLIGHADAPPQILPVLMDSIERHIVEYGVYEFFCGNHGGFDRLVFRALTIIRQRYPHIRRILVTPYHADSKRLENEEMADELYYPFKKTVMPRYAIVKANYKMIEFCDYMIVYVCHTGKARDYLEYAEGKSKKRNLHIENVADRI